VKQNCVLIDPVPGSAGLSERRWTNPSADRRQLYTVESRTLRSHGTEAKPN